MSLKNLLLIAALTSLRLAAQTEIGAATINGTITDPSSAAVGGAKVTIKSTETGLARAAETNNAGFYLVKLPVGKYDVTVEAPGFRQAEIKGVQLAVGAAVTVDVPLQVGNTSETVDVTADVPVVEATRSSTSTSVSARAVADLPVNGRNFIDFTTLTPGVVKDPTTSRSGDLSFAGQRGPANSLLVDGADSNNLFFAQATGRTGFRPYAFSQDAVQEFQVNANSFPAEVGRAAGGAINMITKSGTNDFHGSAFEFYRDKGMNANTFVNNRAGVKKTPYHFNQFGGSLGGPIKRDKAFFFLNYDEQKNNNSNVLTPPTVPTPAQFPVFQKYFTPYPTGIENRVALAKGDLNLTDRDRISVRYNLSRYTGVNLENATGTSALEHTGDQQVNTDNLAATYTRIISASLVWESRFNFVKDDEPGLANTTGPEVNIVNGISFGAFSIDPRYTNTKAYQPTSNVTWVKGSHTIKTGFDFNFLRAENYFPGNFAGSYTFNSYQDFINNTPARFVQGFSSTGTTAPISHPDVNEWAFFAQDSWRLNERLTLNYGLRYDYFGYRQPDTKNTNAQLLSSGLDTSQIPTDAGNVGPRFGFAYRATKSDRVVIRGGYGISYERTAGLLISTAILQNGIDVLTYTLNTGVPKYPNILTAPPGAAAPPDIYVVDPKFKTARAQQFNLQTEMQVGRDASVTVGYLGVNATHLTRTRDINLLPSLPVTGYLCPTPAACTADQATPVTYYRHGGAGTAIVRPNPAFGRVSLFESGANSIYHGVFIQYTRRFANNFQVLASYTFSKVIDSRPDNTAVVSGNSGDDAKLAQDTLLPNLDRAVGDAHIPHRFVFSGVWDINYALSNRSPVVRQIVNHWQISMIAQAQSGRPYNALVTGDPNGDANSFNDRTPGVGRNTIIGPNFLDVDARLSRDIPLRGERLKLRLIGEAFNITNRANFTSTSTPSIAATQYNFAGGFFRPTSNFLQRIANGDPRILQLAVKILF
jgi:outer membrane receptor protein involved in Fe transport